jgi:outer membrane immunogenic protein
MKKLFLATTALVALVSFGPSEAADLSRPMMKAPPPMARPACAQFGGFYVGGQVGWGYYDHQWKELDSWVGDTEDDLPDTVKTSKSGFMGGVQGGYSWQSNCTVFGVEVDYNWASIKAHEFYTDGDTPVPDTFTFGSKLRGFGTVRARTGVVLDNLLLYVTGGLAFASFKRDWTLFEDDFDESGPATETFASSRTRWGWTAGFGTEWAIDANWSIKSEVLYARFEKDDRTFITAFSDNPGESKRFSSEDSLWSTRIGVNYRWGGALPMVR